MKNRIMIVTVLSSLLMLSACDSENNSTKNDSSLFNKPMIQYKPDIYSSEGYFSLLKYDFLIENTPKQRTKPHKIFLSNVPGIRTQYGIDEPCSQSTCIIEQNLEPERKPSERHYVLETGINLPERQLNVSQSISDKTIAHGTDAITKKEVVTFDMSGKALTAANLSITNTERYAELIKKIDALKLQFPSGTTCYAYKEQVKTEYISYHPDDLFYTFKSREKALKEFGAEVLPLGEEPYNIAEEQLTPFRGNKGVWGDVSWYDIIYQSITGQAISAHLGDKFVPTAALVDTNVYKANIHKPTDEVTLSSSDTCNYFDAKDIDILDSMMMQVFNRDITEN